jgi:uncharacterized membrane protein YedE/YeeE
MTFWPFWMGGVALAGVAVGYLLLLRRPLGVSAMIAATLDPEERQAEADAEAGGALALAELEAAMAEATARAFGGSAGAATSLAAEEEPALHAATGRLGPRLSWSVHALFLVGIVLGAAVSSLLAGARPTFDPGPTFASLIGQGAAGYLALFMGGALVGFGTRMAGGCTSGHGLVGCARLQPGSLVSTGCFFGLGIALSFLLAWVAA